MGRGRKEAVNPGRTPAFGSKSGRRAVVWRSPMSYWLAALQWSKVTEKLPPDFLSKTGVFLLIVLVIVIAVKIYQGSNKIMLSILLAAGVGIVFFSWVYNRNEPAFLTPVIEPLSSFFPTKEYTRPEAGDLDKTGKGGNKPKPKP